MCFQYDLAYPLCSSHSQGLQPKPSNFCFYFNCKSDYVIPGFTFLWFPTALRLQDGYPLLTQRAFPGRSSIFLRLAMLLSFSPWLCMDSPWPPCWGSFLPQSTLSGGSSQVYLNSSFQGLFLGNLFGKILPDVPRRGRVVHFIYPPPAFIKN